MRGGLVKPNRLRSSSALPTRFSNYLLEDYDAAIAQYTKTLELNTGWIPTLLQAAIVRSHQGRHQEALDLTYRVLTVAPGAAWPLADVAYVHARASKAGEARALLRRAKVSDGPPFNIGRAHVALGEPDSAFVWLERSEWKWAHRGMLAALQGAGSAC
jgi:tetratricopeptide (TPR) repeat protein